MAPTTVPEDSSSHVVNVMANDDEGPANEAAQNIALDATTPITVQPSHGSATVDAGKILYTPNADYFGSDSLTYKICDNGQSWNTNASTLQNDFKCSTATVTITVTEVTSVPQPDGKIKRSSDATYLGNDVYNTTGEAQTRGWTVHRNRSRTFNLRFQNDGAADDSFIITGPSSSRKFRLTYLVGTTDVTSQVIAGTYSTDTVAPGGSAALTLRIRATRRARIGDEKAALVTGTPSTDDVAKDAVKGKITVN